MANKLAKLDDLKAALEVTGTDADADLTRLLEAAAAITERIAGVVAGGLRRQTAITEYPRPASDRSQIISLDRRPLESITSIKLLYGPATPTEFTNDATALVEGTDFDIHSAELSQVILYDDWWRFGERSNQIVYTAGFADPDDAVGGDAIEPPDDLQGGNIEQAVMLFNQRRTAGLKGVEAGGASGMLGDTRVHPRLKAAATRYRRYGL